MNGDLSKTDSFSGRQLRHIDIEDISGSFAWRLRNGSICRFDVQRTNSPHLHVDGYETCLVLSGEGLYQHGSLKAKLEAGDLFLADPGIIHEISSHDTGNLVLAFFVFFITGGADCAAMDEEKTQGRAGRGDRIIENFLQRHDVLRRGCHELSDYAKLLARPEGRGEADSFGAELLWRAFVFECLEKLGVPSSGKGGGGAIQESTVLDKAFEFIEANCMEGLTAEKVARGVGISSRQLRRLLQKEYGCGIHERIEDAKLKRAMHLLAMRFSIAEVARKLGESSQAQFSRLFKRRTGITPKEYQERCSPRRPGSQWTRVPDRLQ